MRQSLALLKATLPVGVDGTGRRAPGVTVLAGPAGGGKTTTLVKLATRQVRLHGAQSTVLVAADARRIGAFESLQAYGRLLGVPVVQARGAEELAEHVAAFAHKPLVLVDHVPLELADTLPLPAADSLGDCDGVKRELRRLLVLPATLETSAFEAQVALHRRHRVSHVVLTQIDRATRLASCFAPLIRHALPIAHVSDDSRVLTPLGAADAATLVATAMTRGQEKASDKDEELLLNLLQPTRRVVESVTAADEAAAGRASASTDRTTNENRTADAGAATGSAGNATENGAEHRPETASDRETTLSPPSADAGTDDAIVRQGTLERIVAFEVVDHDSVIENGGALDTVETREVIESLGDVPSALLDDTSPELESSGRRARAARRARRGTNERTNRQGDETMTPGTYSLALPIAVTLATMFLLTGTLLIALLARRMMARLAALEEMLEDSLDATDELSETIGREVGRLRAGGQEQLRRTERLGRQVEQIAVGHRAPRTPSASRRPPPSAAASSPLPEADRESRRWCAITASRPTRPSCS